MDDVVIVARLVGAVITEAVAILLEHFISVRVIFVRVKQWADPSVEYVIFDVLAQLARRIQYELSQPRRVPACIDFPALIRAV